MSVYWADEETGRCVGNLKVSLRRRWNYENTVSAIVCHLSWGKLLKIINFINMRPSGLFFPPYEKCLELNIGHQKS